MKKPRLCFISGISPFTANGGSSIRISEFLNSLVEDWDVSIVCLTRFGSDADSRTPLAQRVEEVTIVENERSRTNARLRWIIGSYPYKVYLSDFRSCRRYPDIVATYSNRSFDRYLAIETESLPLLKAINNNPRKNWLDIHNWHSGWCESFMQSDSFVRRMYGWLSLRKQQRFEREFFPVCDNVVCVTESDRDEAKKIFPNHEYHIVPNGVSERFLNAGVARESKSVEDGFSETVLFVGSLDVEMNVVGVEWLVKRVWPRVLQSRPNAKLQIVGRKPDKRVLQLEGKSITISSNVQDVLPFYRRCKLVVNPVTIGGGSKLKVFEALATGLPFVSTSKGLVGLEQGLRESIRIADDPADFANAILAGMSEDASPPNNAIDRYIWKRIAKGLSDSMLKGL